MNENETLVWGNTGHGFGVKSDEIDFWGAEPKLSGGVSFS